MINKFNSIVNDVTLKVDKDKKLVVKKYADFALKTGWALPIERYKVEHRILEKIQCLNLKNSAYVSVPMVINVNELLPVIEMQFIEGITFSELLIRNQLDEVDFFKLGVWLRSVEVELYRSRDEIFSELWHVQSDSAQIISKYKGFLNETLHGGDVSVSLGDVGMDNLICTTSKLYVIDLEFAHLTYDARDIGQLWAQLEARVKLSNKYSNQLIKGYVSNGGNEKNAIAWCIAFRPYYKNSKLRDI